MPSRRHGHHDRDMGYRGHGKKLQVHHNNTSPGGVTPTTAVDVLSDAKSLVSGNRHGVITKTTDGRDVLTRPQQLIKSKQMTVQTRLTSDTLVANAWAPTNNQYMDFRIMPSSNIHYVDELTFVFTVTNNLPTPPLGGNNDMYLGPWYQMFDRIELLADGTSTQDQIYPLQAFLMTSVTRKDEERAMAAENEGINRDTSRNSAIDRYLLTNYDAYNHGNGIVLAPGDSHIYRFKCGTLLDYADLFLPNLTTWPTIRFYFGGKNFEMSTSPVLADLTKYPTLTNAELLLSGTFLGSPQQLAAYKDYYNSFPSVSCGLMYDRQTLQPYTAVTGQESTDLILTGMSGKMAGLFVVMKPPNLSNEAQFSPGNAQTFVHLDKVTFKQQDGTVQSFEKQDVDWFRSILFAKQWPSCVALEKCILWYPFCSDPMSLIHYGADTGSYQMTTRESFRFTPLTVTNNAVPGTPVVIEVFGVRYGQLIYCKGMLNAFKSDDKVVY